MSKCMFTYTLKTLLLGLLFIAISTAAEAQPRPKKQPATTRILFVLDASGSMVAKLDKGTRWEVARALLSRLVDSLRTEPNLQMALRVYGHQFENRYNNCQDTKLEVPFAPDNAPKIQKKLRALVPKGNTPISYSLLQSADDFPKDPNARNILILITDGLESCNEDPCAVSLALQKKQVFMKPFIVGIGTDKDFSKQFSCIGQYLNAADASSFKKALNKMVNQALKRTTVSVLLTDELGRPYENNLNMTFINNVTNQPKYNYVHYYDQKGKTDTLNIDPVLSYDLIVNTIPPVYRKDLPIISGKHNEIKVPAPQGFLHIKQDGMAAVTQIAALVKVASSDRTINTQMIGTKEKYLSGRYDLEILTLPRIYKYNIEIKPGETTPLNVPLAGVLNIQGGAEGFGSLYEVLSNGEQRWIYNFPTTGSRLNVAMQPGNYRVVFRSKSAKASEYTDAQDFSIKSGTTTNVRLFAK